MKPAYLCRSCGLQSFRFAWQCFRCRRFGTKIATGSAR